VAPQRPRQPRAETERDRWLAGSPCAGAVTHACPAPLGVHMAERAGASQEGFGDVLRREPRPRAQGSMRAKAPRRLAPGAGQRYVWAEMPPPRALGPRTIDLARPPDRSPRWVPRAVPAQPVTFYGARRPGGKRPPVTGSAVDAKEPSPPEGETPVEW
jgi:hypothetical protein